MAHNHDHTHAHYDKAFAWGIALNVGYIVVEVIFGLWVNSLALLADAGHNLSDVLGLVLAWGAHYLTRLKPTERHTYGWRSTSILAALTNALILLVAIGGIAWEAVQRIGSPAEVGGTTVMWVAGTGVAINGLTAMLFYKGRHGDLNIRGAFLHMAADAAVSLGVVVAGAVIYLTGWNWVDPVTSLAVALIIFLGTWGLLRDSVDLALHAVPQGIDTGEVREYLRSLPGVSEVHDLHIWGLSTTHIALTAHLVKPDADNEDELLARISEELHERFGIEHSTVQMERDADTAQCRQAPPEAV